MGKTGKRNEFESQETKRNILPITSHLSPFRLHPGVYAPRRAFRLQGFTLIELVVVILIISTLAALLSTGASKLFDNAKKVQAKNDLTEIVNAVNAYYTEYGKYPLVDSRQGADQLYGKSNTAPGNEDLCNVLRAIATGANASDALNPRKIVFLSGKDSSRARSGFTTTATTDSQGKPINIGAFIDSYRNAYMIAIDGDYDSMTKDALPYNDLTYATSGPNKLVRTDCFGVSFGKDGTQGKASNKNYSGSDDILSWQ